MLQYLLRLLVGGMAWLAGASLASGHAMDTNLYVQMHLHEDKLVCEVDVGSFQFPPLREVEFGRPDTHPTLDEKREELERFFREKCPIEIDGIAVQPVLTSLKLEDFEAADHLMRAMDIVYVGLKFEYSLKRQPRRISMKWGFFAQPHEDDGGNFPVIPDDPSGIGGDLGHNAREVVADFIIHGEPDEYDMVYFSPEEPEYIWHRPAPERSAEELAQVTAIRGGAGIASRTALRYGLFAVGSVLALLGLISAGGKLGRRLRNVCLFAAGSVACVAGGLFTGGAGAGSLSDTKAIDTFKALHANIYSAFDHNTEDEIYDALAQSVDGSLLDHVYNDVFESLILRSEGGVMAKVQKVETLKTEIKAVPGGDSDSFVIDCVWRVHGFVKHYSHTHRRLNEYHASYEMAPRGGKWKIIKSVETKRERLDGQVPGSSDGVAPPLPQSGGFGAIPQDSGDAEPDLDEPTIEILPDEVPEDLNLPGILGGNTME